MGILYSHIVFQPPSPSTYDDDGGLMSFRRVRQEHSEDSSQQGEFGDEDSSFHTDRSRRGSAEEDTYIKHPIFYLTTSRGNTIPAAYFHQPDSYYTILFSHGNGEDLGVTASYALELSNALKTSVLCYDYSGYGLATGKPSETNCYADIRAVYNHLITSMRIPPHRIVLFGRSLGSGPTIDLATSLGPNLAGVVLIAALTSCVRVIFTGAAHTMKFDMFPNIDKVPHIQVPIFVVHGTADDVVPFSHGSQLSRAAKYPLEPLWVRDAAHNNLESSRYQYQVFLRYMSVLQELRRWKQPNSILDGDSPRRPDSFGPLGKVAGCFGPQRPRTEASPDHKTPLVSRASPPRRKRFTRTQSISSPSQMLGHRRVGSGRIGSSRDLDFKSVWRPDDEPHSGFVRRSSGSSFGSRVSLQEHRPRGALGKGKASNRLQNLQQATVVPVI